MACQRTRRPGTAPPPLVRPPADPVHPTADGDVALDHGPLAPKLDQAAALARRLGEAAVLGVADAVAALVDRAPEDARRPALLVQLERRPHSDQVEDDPAERLGDVVALDGAPRQVDDRGLAAREAIPPRVAAHAHGPGRVVA